MTPGREYVWCPGPDENDPGPDELGGKGAQLARLAQLAIRVGARVPAFVVLRARAFDRRPGTPNAADGESRGPSELMLAEITEALAHAGLGSARVAVRSSATSEDGRDASFAGQFETVLGVRADDPVALAAAIERVWDSAAGARALAYQARGGNESAAGVRMAVVIQEMVEARAAGVAFAADPVNGDRDTTVVSAVLGLGEGLVSGELDADTWHVGVANTAPRAVIAHKTQAVRGLPEGGTRFEPVPAGLQDVPALHAAEVARVTHAVREISTLLEMPQDLEWAIDARGLALLQTRPITTLVGAPAISASPSAAAPPVSKGPALEPPAPDAPAGAGRRVWDNSNIIESYAGVTTPLTFTFARAVYEDVYRQFCRVMGVSDELIAANHGVFAYMLGLVRGRVYYNLINWYRLIALLPGFTWNRSFMERMMGVREALEAPPPPPGSGSRLRDFASLMRMLARMVGEHGKLAREVPAFHSRVRDALAPVEQEDLSGRPASRNAALYRTLERELLQHWRPPLVNDFFAMIFFGVLGRLIEKWLPGSPVTLANDLLCGEGGIISTEPARRVMALARQVRADPAVAAVFSAEPDDARLWQRVMSEPELSRFRAALLEYVAKFGDRCLEELKLETVTLREDPGFLLRMVRAYALQGADDPEGAGEREQRIRRDAEQSVNARVQGVRRVVFHWVLRGARARVRDRENLRFERTRVFGVVRRMLLGVGADLARGGRLHEARDVFWLTIDEVLAAAEGREIPRTPTDPAATVADSGEAGTGVELASLVLSRKEMFARYAAAPAPPPRFETQGALVAWVGPGEAEIPLRAAGVALDGDLRGTGCCPGVVRAAVCIVRDPREGARLNGQILVAERTDPGWTLLFPAARGLLVERGSLLSHSAIVAREMGLPCVVGIAGLLETLRDGEIVEMDGASGVVRRMDVVASPPGTALATPAPAPPGAVAPTT